MTATVLHIIEKRKAHVADVARLEDFHWRAGARLDADFILRNPAVTLYCLDERRRRAIFVETPSHVDVSEHAFYYQGQYAYAVRLLAVSYETLRALSEAAGDVTPSVIVIFSLGRCGSTLLSQIFRGVPAVYSVSEPDVFTQLCAARQTQGRRDADLAERLRSAMRLLCRDRRGQTLALKPRSTVVDIGDLVRRVYPDAKIIFLHRDLDSWARSMIRAFGVSRCPEFVARVLARQPCVAAYLNRPDTSIDSRSSTHGARRDDREPMRQLADRLTQIPAANALALMWLGLMERYRALRREGVPMFSMSYDTLVRDREGAVRQVFDYCGVPAAYVAAACQAFDEDAQRHSPLARTQLVDRDPIAVDRHMRVMHRVLDRYPFARTAPARGDGMLRPAGICEPS